MQRSIKVKSSYSTFDKTPENHVKVTELVLERAMRLLNSGKMLLFCLTALRVWDVRTT